eukprot:RCo009929
MAETPEENRGTGSPKRTLSRRSSGCSDVSNRSGKSVGFSGHHHSTTPPRLRTGCTICGSRGPRVSPEEDDEDDVEKRLFNTAEGATPDAEGKPLPAKPRPKLSLQDVLQRAKK